ncbi:hypothetical protein A2997_01835 [Candidatus Nomurabacteria bacterium RIFCSPLOWO2_01_FULL_36_10b]|uniref:Homing endonuclease LAGLIDADG domain-containing protein n=1 Tax=Candidatus Nomurabacteria bacterium RIFCSPLOWO2_01_FULL_36_10b TaxID=1801766 RepID=A0A1F6WNK0_9BACT|nr:MAG: hypothetical protein A2997_01835 [Candidatus Nomurabacteria bacterium RIFCSPLOWO2_01_FULL_36_10b]
MPALKNKRNIYEYISGYVDGEGCFSISFSKREKFLVGWETKPSFSVSQNGGRAQILFIMKKVFKCGFIRRDYSDKTLKYEVRSLSDLVSFIIPHFNRYPLVSAKQKDFEFFKKVCFFMQIEMHKNKKGLNKIMNLAFRMNPSGKRKYTKAEMQKTLR